MKVTYDKSISSTLLPIIKERFDKYLYLTPDWCQSVVIFFNDNNPDDLSLACSTDFHYRFARINVYPSFLNDDDWETSIIHEMIHILQAPYMNKVQSIIEQFMPSAIAEYLIKDLDNEEEGITQDMTLKFFNVIKVDTENSSMV